MSVTRSAAAVAKLSNMTVFGRMLACNRSVFSRTPDPSRNETIADRGFDLPLPRSKAGERSDSHD